MERTDSELIAELQTALEYLRQNAGRLNDRIRELEAELASLRSTRMNCAKDGQCQHCGADAVCCYHPTVAEYANAAKRIAELKEYLVRYGGHLGGCANPWSNGQLKCDCGFDNASGPKEE